MAQAKAKFKVNKYTDRQEIFPCTKRRHSVSWDTSIGVFQQFYLFMFV